jgi:alkylation response protein AidB-like acyl-CoA dehydrogenase
MRQTKIFTQACYWNGWSLGLTEANTGSDAEIENHRRKRNDWILNGQKLITHGKTGDIAVVIARTGEPRARIMRPLLWWKKTAGFSGEKKQIRMRAVKQPK